MARSPHRRALLLFALCGAVGVHGAYCLVTIPVYGWCVGSEASVTAPPLLQSTCVDIDGPLNGDRRWVTDLSSQMPEGLELHRAHEYGSGSSANQYESLVSSQVDAAGQRTVIDSVSFSWSGNHPTWYEIDAIIPLCVTPFGRRQFWFRRAQWKPTTVLFEVGGDGRFTYYHALWALVPFLCSLVPMALWALCRRQKWTSAPGFLALAAWCVAFRPWVGWGL